MKKIFRKKFKTKKNKTKLKSSKTLGGLKKF